MRGVNDCNKCSALNSLKLYGCPRPGGDIPYEYMSMQWVRPVCYMCEWRGLPMPLDFRRPAGGPCKWKFHNMRTVGMRNGLTYKECRKCGERTVTAYHPRPGQGPPLVKVEWLRGAPWAWEFPVPTSAYPMSAVPPKRQ